MRFKQLSDVLDWAQALHRKLAELYRDRAGSHTQDRIGMLLTYLAEHENALALALAGALAVGVGGIRPDLSELGRERLALLFASEK